MIGKMADEFDYKLKLGGVDGILQFPLHSITGSIIPSLQQQFGCFGLSLGVIFLNVLIESD